MLSALYTLSDSIKLTKCILPINLTTHHNYTSLWMYAYVRVVVMYVIQHNYMLN